MIWMQGRAGGEASSAVKLKNCTSLSVCFSPSVHINFNGVDAGQSWLRSKLSCQTEQLRQIVCLLLSKHTSQLQWSGCRAELAQKQVQLLEREKELLDKDQTVSTLREEVCLLH